jgi:hypothetical protein
VQISTRQYKLTPIRRKVRQLYEQAGRPPGGVEQWLGISLDETHRMRASDVRYITLRYVLVERRMTRADCQRWLDAHGWPGMPRSSCIGCLMWNHARSSRRYEHARRITLACRQGCWKASGHCVCQYRTFGSGR